MENLIGRIAKLPDGTRVRITRVEGTIAITYRIEGANEGITAVIEVEKLELLNNDD